jgi:hypothetical protein
MTAMGRESRIALMDCLEDASNCVPITHLSVYPLIYMLCFACHWPAMACWSFVE